MKRTKKRESSIVISHIRHIIANQLKNHCVLQGQIVKNIETLIGPLNGPYVMYAKHFNEIDCVGLAI